MFWDDPSSAGGMMTAPKCVSKSAYLTYYNFNGVSKHEEVIK